jgi:hypothetical protein
MAKYTNVNFELTSLKTHHTKHFMKDQTFLHAREQHEEKLVQNVIPSSRKIMPCGSFMPYPTQNLLCIAMFTAISCTCCRTLQ